MNVGQLVQALRREGTVTVRGAFLRFHDENPDILGPPGRSSVIEEMRGDSRLLLDIEQVRLR